MTYQASGFSTEMAAITGNVSGAVQNLPRVSAVGGRQRIFVASIPLTGQPLGSVIAIARLPKGAIPLEFEVNTTVSLGSSTLSIGDVNNVTLFVSPTTLTTVNTPTRLGTAATLGAPLDGPNYDSVTGNVSLAYEDVVMTVLAAALPVGGTLRVLTTYTID